MAAQATQNDKSTLGKEIERTFGRQSLSKSSAHRIRCRYFRCVSQSR